MRYLHMFPGSVCLFCCSEICGLILRIYKSLTDTWMYRNWDWGGNTDFRYTMCLCGFQSASMNLASLYLYMYKILVWCMEELLEGNTLPSLFVESWLYRMRVYSIKWPSCLRENNIKRNCWDLIQVSYILRLGTLSMLIASLWFQAVLLL